MSCRRHRVEWLSSLALCGVTPQQGNNRLAVDFSDVVAWSPAVARGGFRHYKVTFSLLLTFLAIIGFAVTSGVATASGVTRVLLLFLVVVLPTGVQALSRWVAVQRESGVWLLHPIVVLQGSGSVSLVGAVGSKRQTRTFLDPAALVIEDGWFLDGSLIRITAADGMTIELAAPMVAARRLAVAAAA